MVNTMMSYRLYGANDIRYESVEIPNIPEGGVRGKNLAIGICASDGKLWHDGDAHSRRTCAVHKTGKLAQNPIIIMHEGCFQDTNGQLWVFQADHYESDGTPMAIGYAKNGAACEIVTFDREVVNGGYLIKVPDGIDAISAAIAEPYACALHSMEETRDYKNVLKGGNVAIFGFGPLGMIHFDLMRSSKPENVYIIENQDPRLEKARTTYARLGNEYGMNIHVIDFSKNDPFDFIPKKSIDDLILCAPVGGILVKMIDQDIFRKGAHANIFAGMPADKPKYEIDLRKAHYLDLHIHNTSGSSIKNYETILQAVADGTINPLNVVVAVGGLDSIEEGFKAVAVENKYPGKVVILPGQRKGRIITIEELMGGHDVLVREEAKALVNGDIKLPEKQK